MIGRRGLVGLGLLCAASALPCPAAKAQDLDATPLPPGKTVTVKIGVGALGQPTQLGIWVAKYAGYFDRLKPAGIEVDLVPFGGGSDAMLALAGGQTQMSYQFVENGLRAAAQGRDIRIIYAALPVPALALVVRKDLIGQIKTVPDIKGHRLGMTAFGTGTYTVALRVLAHYGLDPAQVQWTPVGGTAGYLPSIREGRVDVLSATTEAANQLVLEGSAAMLIDLTDPGTVQEIYGYPYLSIGLMASGRYVDGNPYVAARVVAALHQAILYIKAASSSEIAKILPAEFQSPTLETSIRQLAVAHSAIGIVDTDVIERMLADINDLKLVSTARLTAEKLVDNRFAAAALNDKR
jgi:NitT/TauT family transport system substrate-binding protein